MEKTGSRLICLLMMVIPIVEGLRLGAFNVRVFGPSKSSQDNIMDVLAQIAVRYDILLILEIRDKSGQTIPRLQKRIHQNYGVTMRAISSDRLGRTSSKEQYAFLYREDHGLSVVDSDHFDDGDEQSGTDLFEREPFIVRFHSARCKVRDFTLVALHTTPSQTVSELKALPQVLQEVRQAWNTDDIIILGDLNADCSYVPQKAWPTIELRHDPDLLWPIGDEVDTTVNANTDCAYDRFIVAGQALRSTIIPGSCKTFNFADQYKMTDEEALAVSDHYPIELALQDSSGSAQSYKTTGASRISTFKTTSANKNRYSAQNYGTNGASRRSTIAAMAQRVWNSVVEVFASDTADSDL